jgi:low temperature requirement protein LtrA
VLGESVLAVSIGVSEVGWDAPSMATASFAFLAAVSIWWTYFDRSGRDALSGNMSVAFIWGYGHFAIFAGIAALGVGTELLIEAAGPSEAVALAATEPVAGSEGAAGPGPAVFAGGLAAFLAGMTLINLSNLGFRVTPIARIGLSLRLGVALGVVAVAWLLTPSPLAFAAVAGIAMLALNAIEATIVARLRRQRAAAAAAAA